MNDMLLLKNGTMKVANEKKKFKHSDKVKYVFLGISSAILGDYYYTMPFQGYMESRKIESITLKYGFVDGVVTDDEWSTEEDLRVDYEYTYKSLNDFFSKIAEIIVAEDALNEIYWTSSAFYAYYFTNLHVKVKYKNKKKPKKMGLGEFYKIFGFESYRAIKENVIKLKHKKEEWCESVKIGNKSYFKTCGNMFFNPMIDDISKVTKIKYEVEATGRPLNFILDDKDSRECICHKTLDFTLSDYRMMMYIFGLPMYEIVINDIEEKNFSDIKVKAKFTCKYKDGSSNKYKR